MDGQTSANKEQKPSEKEENSTPFECNICLSSAEEPVISMCGHLFCWPCISQWMQGTEKPCPVCKSAVSKEKLIPVYGRGKESKDPRTNEPRPQGRRTPTQSQPQNGFYGTPFGTAYNGNNYSFQVGFGMFPFPLIPFQFAQSFPANNHNPRTPQEQDNAMMSKAFFIFALMILFFLITM